MVKKILLLGAASSASVNFIKSLKLSSEDIEIVGVDLNKYYLELSPVEKKFLIKRDKNNPEEYISKINSIIDREEINFVHAQPDPEVQIISDYRDKIRAKTFLPSKEAVDISHNKWLTYEVLKKQSIPLAKTIKVETEENLKSVFEEIDGLVWLRASSGAGGKASLPVRDFSQARMWINYWVERGLSWEDFLASEVLPGTEVSWLSIWKNGELICSQGKQRVEWVQSGLSPSGVTGTTAIQKTVHNEKVNEVATQTVRALDKNPEGIYVVDTKENKEGIPCVTEINPGRFFTTSLFFPTAGVNMPLIYVKLAYGDKIPPVAPINSVKKDLFWVRIPDGGPVMFEEGKFSSEEI